MALRYLDPRFHLIIVLGRGADWIEPCLNAVMAQTLPPCQVTVFDNTANGPLGDWLQARFPAISLMRSPRDLGFTAGCNRAAAAAREADFLMLLDPDVVLALDALERLADTFAAHPRTGVLGCKVLDRDVETIRHVGQRLSANGLAADIGQGEPDRGQYCGLSEPAAVPTAVLGLRAELWDELGGLDETLGPSMYEGIDFCFRARAAGWQVGVTCEATATHLSPRAPRRRDPEYLGPFFRSRARFLRRHYGLGGWLTRYLPGELGWMLDIESKGMRRAALKALF